MPKNKSQHFVPQVLIKQFSIGDAVSATNLWLPKQGIFKNEISIRHQCAKPFLYGKNLEIERMYQFPESEFGKVSKKIRSNQQLTQFDLSFLLLFWLLQRNRSYLALANIHRAFREVRTRAFAGDEYSEFIGEELGLDKLSEIALSQTREQLSHITDLSITTLRAPRGSSFILSDNPATFSSKFIHQKYPKYGGYGIAASGFFCTLPISPEYCFFAYDPNVYSRLSSPICLITKTDTRAINALTLVNCDNSIYFHNWNYRKEIEVSLRKYSSAIPEERIRINLAVERERLSEKGSRYFESATDLDYKASKGGLIHWQHLNPKPPFFPNFLKYKINPIFVDTRSGMGLIRPGSRSHDRYLYG